MIYAFLGGLTGLACEIDRLIASGHNAGCRQKELTTAATAKAPERHITCLLQSDHHLENN